MIHFSFLVLGEKVVSKLSLRVVLCIAKEH